jgi:hypothetical protein
MHPSSMARLALPFALLGLFGAACAGAPAPAVDRGGGTLEALVSSSQQPSADLSYLGKIDSHLQDLLVVRMEGRDVRSAAESSGLRLNEAGDVMVDVYVTGSATEAAAGLTSIGMQVAATNESTGLVEGFVPIDLVLEIAELDSTKAILAAALPGRGNPSP